MIILSQEVYYENAPDDGSTRLSGDNNLKVIRGGSLENIPGDCRSFYRTYQNKSSHNNFISLLFEDFSN